MAPVIPEIICITDPLIREEKLIQQRITLKIMTADSEFFLIDRDTLYALPYPIPFLRTRQFPFFTSISVFQHGLENILHGFIITFLLKSVKLYLFTFSIQHVCSFVFRS